MYQKEIQESNHIFDLVNEIDNVKHTDEYKRFDPYPEAPQYDEFVSMNDLDNSELLEFNEDDLMKKMQDLSSGHFEFKTIPENYDDDLEALKDTKIFKDINENKFLLSYYSPFDNAKTGVELQVPSQYETINAALKEAAPGDTIVLEDGSYQETVVIKKPVEIRSKSNNRASCVIYSTEQDCIVLKTGLARLTAVTVKCEAPGNSYCIKCDGGFIETNNCCIDSKCAGAFSVNQQCVLWAQNCEVIASSKDVTVQMPDSRMAFYKCNFTINSAKNNKYLGPRIINIGESATGILDECSYRSIKVSFNTNSRGMIRGGEINEVDVGIMVHENAEALISKISFTNCSSQAIFLSQGSRAVIQNCNIVFDDEITSVGVQVNGAKDFAIINDCKLSGNLVGCRIVAGIRGLILNTHFDNTLCGIQKESKCNLTIRNSVFSKNRKTGIILSCEGDIYTKIYHSEFLNNHTSIVVFKEATASIHNCTLAGSKREIVAEDSTFIKIKDSKIGIKEGVASCETGESILLSKNSKVKLSNTSIQNAKEGIICSGSSILEINRCDIKVKNKAIQSKESSHITISAKSIISSKILLQDESEINVFGSELSADKDNDIEASGNSKVNIAESNIFISKYGLTIENNVVCHIQRSEFKKHLSQNDNTIIAGINIQGSDDGANRPVLDINDVKFVPAGQAAINASNLFESGQLNITKCNFCEDSVLMHNKKNKEYAIKANRVQNANVVDCNFNNINECIVIDHMSSFVILSSIFQMNCTSITSEQSSLRIEGCQFNDIKLCAVSLLQQSKAIVLKSSFANIRVSNNEISVKDDSVCQDYECIYYDRQ